jgi:hypothetical protein
MKKLDEKWLNAIGKGEDKNDEDIERHIEIGPQTAKEEAGEG